MSTISERIIEEVKLHPILYDLSHPDSKNTHKRGEAWDEIGQTLNADGTDLKKKWKNLRDIYGKCIKMGTSKDKSINRYKTWPWVQHMSFFKPFIQHASGRNNDNPPNLKAYKPTIKSPVAKKRRCEDEPHSSEQPTSIDKVLSYLQNRPSKTQSLDELDLLFMGYAQTVKKFSARRQTLVKYQFAKILMEEELRQQIDDKITTVSGPTSEITDADYTTSPSRP